MKMKKLLLPALALFSCLSAEAQFTDLGGQKAGDSKGNWYIGVGSGFHTNFMRYSDLDEDYYPDSKNLNSGVFNVFFQYEFGKKRIFAIRPEIALLRRGGRLNNIGSNVYDYEASGLNDIHYTLKARYVDIRVPLIYNFLDADSKIRPYVYIAPALGFATRGTIRMQEDDVDGFYYGYGMDLSKANMAGVYFSGSIGVGAKYQFEIAGNTFFVGLEADYELGFTDTYGSKEKDGEATVNPDLVEMELSKPGYELEGTRKFSGIEIKATLGVPFSVFKKKAAPAPTPVAVTPAPQPKPEPKPVVKEKPCYTLEEINDMMLRGEPVEGKTICAIDAINFDFGKSTIKRESHDYLNKLANTLIRTNAKIEVKGHTDNVGTEEFNMKLSKDRAKAVMDYLISRGVNKNKLTYSYYGMSRPLTTNDTEEGRTMNRRVEFEILK